MRVCLRMEIIRLDLTLARTGVICSRSGLRSDCSMLSIEIAACKYTICAPLAALTKTKTVRVLHFIRHSSSAKGSPLSHQRQDEMFQSKFPVQPKARANDFFHQPFHLSIVSTLAPPVFAPAPTWICDREWSWNAYCSEQLNSHQVPPEHTYNEPGSSSALVRQLLVN